MEKRKFFLSVGIVGILVLCMSIFAFAADYSTSDLEGEWQYYSISVDEWVGLEYGDYTIYDDGSYDKFFRYVGETGSDSGTTVDGTLELSGKGEITDINDNSLNGFMSSDKNFAVLVYNSTNQDYPGGNRFAIAVKKENTRYEQSDLYGKWDKHSIVVGGRNQASTEVITIDDDTSLLINSSTGNITNSTDVDESQVGIMTADKNIIVMNNVVDQDQYVLSIAAKRGGSFSQSDLAGVWKEFDVRAGPNWQGWMFGRLDINRYGETDETVTLDNGTVNEEGFTIKVQNDGVLISENNFLGILTLDKNIQIDSSIDDSGQGQVLSIGILKEKYNVASSGESNGSDNGGGGCLMNPEAPFAYSWLLLLIVPGYLLMRRRT